MKTLLALILLTLATTALAKREETDIPPIPPTRSAPHVIVLFN